MRIPWSSWWLKQKTRNPLPRAEHFIAQLSFPLTSHWLELVTRPHLPARAWNRGAKGLSASASVLGLNVRVLKTRECLPVLWEAVISHLTEVYIVPVLFCDGRSTHAVQITQREEH